METFVLEQECLQQYRYLPLNPNTDYPNSPIINLSVAYGNHTPVSHVLIFPLCCKLTWFQRILLGVTFSNYVGGTCIVRRRGSGRFAVQWKFLQHKLRRPQLRSLHCSGGRRWWKTGSSLPLMPLIGYPGCRLLKLNQISIRMMDVCNCDISGRGTTRSPLKGPDGWRTFFKR